MFPGRRGREATSIDVKRRLVVPTALAWLTCFVPTADAGPLDACAQRVIRDWYSGGRVDKLYPLGCYRAAIRALPTDVLEYSDADKEIARALAFARKTRADDANAPTAPAQEEQFAPATPASPTAAEEEPRPATPQAPPAEPPRAAPERSPNVTARAAAGPEPTSTSAALPYPVILLAALAGTLLAMGATGWLLARRR